MHGIGRFFEVSPDMAGGIDGAAPVEGQVQRALRQAEELDCGEGRLILEQLADLLIMGLGML
ncbi:hypothetical protein SDC9_168085 [bioreactor metagenome]|uniref:Uncharacterized protein n=1 Tax=bioreactor metagenome TaxID=1076179 RepID=A0A645G3J9_9ZZZZ